MSRLKHSIVNRGLKRRAVASTALCESRVQLKVYFTPGIQNGCECDRSHHTSEQDWADISTGLSSGQETHQRGGLSAHGWIHMDTNTRHWKLGVWPTTYSFLPCPTSCWFYLLSISFLFISFPILVPTPSPSPLISLSVPTIASSSQTPCFSRTTASAAKSISASYCFQDKGNNP